MRWKFDRDNYEIYKCFMCLHVRTGTLILGLLHSVLYIGVIAFLTCSFFHPEWIQKLSFNNNITSGETNPLLNNNNNYINNNNNKMINMYCIGVVWGCYKYLKYRELFSGSSDRIRNYNANPNANSLDDTEMLLPPKYEDVIRMSLEQTPPPAYHDEN
ncbi:hypothetical protein HELRODRAFT_194757 [Helobdella robusta]|uniref:Uncharacterized protein n=1 Tax=Helobdella robusta TaxID=6412 RepID=T1FWD5_HELRO|nr:hypothetical protein HELRODRAFT_194757 [Helobdella robusta]ESN89910.1 hypothetical protein HELRODRAFT_194757 [Helobdella robusta]